VNLQRKLPMLGTLGL